MIATKDEAGLAQLCGEIENEYQTLLAQLNEPKPSGRGSASTGPRLPEPPKPEFFYGMDNKQPNVRTWLYQMDQYFSLWPEMPDDKKIVYATNFLKSFALIWWQQCQNMVNIGALDPIVTWATFAQAITYQFGGFDEIDKAKR